MRIKPYIGVTGIMCRNDYLHCAMPFNMGHFTHQLMAGILVSSKTKDGILNGYPKRYPPIESVKALIPGGIDSLNLIHYNTDNPDRLADEMAEVLSFCDERIDGFQLNVCWPEVSQFEEFYKKANRKTVIILQIGRHALEQVNFVPKLLIRKIRSGYLDFIHGILIDPSGGKDQAYEREGIRDYLAELYNADLRINIGIAGGLHGGFCPNGRDNFLDFALKPLAQMYPDLSIDAEGRLRDADDNLDYQEVGKYIHESQAIFNSLI